MNIDFQNRSLRLHDWEYRRADVLIRIKYAFAIYSVQYIVRYNHHYKFITSIATYTVQLKRKFLKLKYYAYTK